MEQLKLLYGQGENLTRNLPERSDLHKTRGSSGVGLQSSSRNFLLTDPLSMQPVQVSYARFSFPDTTIRFIETLNAMGVPGRQSGVREFLTSPCSNLGLEFTSA
jgi:hypothetical protein